ncbi:MAG: hypothetical protein OQK00_02435 [Rhodobacteraceae bacterium]|nr:hypothetical protein [Paracoccaceae bacterium]MCW9043845.1 hypothetical protein [Pseudopelagicola sp.]
MVREIVFHLGDCKTGTTAIQSVLASGMVESSHSICYPARFNHIPLAKTLSVDSERPFQKKRFSALRKAFDQSSADVGIVSAEHFEFVDPEEIRRAIDLYLPAYADRVRLLAYVRPHAERLVSTFAERSKKGQFHKPIEAMHARLIEEKRLFYTPRFTRLRELFGDQFTLRPFIRDHLRDGDVVQDFLHTALSQTPYTLVGQRQPNESLSVQDIAMMRHMHRQIAQLTQNHMKNRKAQRALGWYLSDLLTTLPQHDAQKPRLHQELADEVVRVYRDDAAALDAAFFEGTPMSDALANAPSKATATPQSFRAQDHLSADELRLVEAWATLTARMIEADPLHFAWAVRPQSQRDPKPPCTL